MLRWIKLFLILKQSACNINATTMIAFNANTDSSTKPTHKIHTRCQYRVSLHTAAHNTYVRIQSFDVRLQITRVHVLIFLFSKLRADAWKTETKKPTRYRLVLCDSIIYTHARAHGRAHFACVSMSGRHCAMFVRQAHSLYSMYTFGAFDVYLEFIFFFSFSATISSRRFVTWSLQISLGFFSLLPTEKFCVLEIYVFLKLSFYTDVSVIISSLRRRRAFFLLCNSFTIYIYSSFLPHSFHFRCGFRAIYKAFVDDCVRVLCHSAIVYLYNGIA